jgi:opacity protein-like surface antigen
MYVAGQVGLTVPHKFTDVDEFGPGVPGGTGLSSLELKNSVMYGAKLGYFFDSAKWLGIETEVFNTTPHFKQQSATLTVPGGGSVTDTLTGQSVRVTVWAPVNLIVRYPGEHFQPYAGVGMGVFFARIKDKESGESSSDTTVGLNTQVGLRYLVTKNVSVFGEYKFNYARLSFDPSDPTQATGGVKGNYQASHFVFGVGYHFN